MDTAWRIKLFDIRKGVLAVLAFMQQGRVYEKNLGPKTTQIAGAMTEYDPDPTWKLVKE